MAAHNKPMIYIFIRFEMEEKTTQKHFQIIFISEFYFKFKLCVFNFRFYLKLSTLSNKLNMDNCVCMSDCISINYDKNDFRKKNFMF